MYLRCLRSHILSETRFKWFILSNKVISSVHILFLTKIPSPNPLMDISCNVNIRMMAYVFSESKKRRRNWMELIQIQSLLFFSFVLTLSKHPVLWWNNSSDTMTVRHKQIEMKHLNHWNEKASWDMGNDCVLSTYPLFWCEPQIIKEKARWRTGF